MAINQKLNERCQGTCELCGSEPATIEYTVSPKSEGKMEHQVAICTACNDAMNASDTSSSYWRCLEGSIWNPEPSVQALSYRLLYKFKEEDWVENVIGSVDLEESVKEWALSAYETSAVHKDAFGNELQNGDNVVLTQALNVKGTNFTASKGTVVKKIRLVHDNPEHIEGKINEQTIVILTKFVKKN